MICKRFLSVLLVLVMCPSLLPTAAFATEGADGSKDGCTCTIKCEGVPTEDACTECKSEGGNLSIIPAIQWACGDGVMQGSDGYLNPKGNASRAHVAQMLKNFIENIIK